MQNVSSVCPPNDITLQARARQTVMVVMAKQIVFVMFLSLVSLILVGNLAAYSVLAGGVSGIIPNFYFDDRLMRRKRWSGARALVRSVYVGEFLKIGFTLALLVLAARFLSIEPPYLLVVYAATVLANWVSVRNVDLG